MNPSSPLFFARQLPPRRAKRAAQAMVCLGALLMLSGAVLAADPPAMPVPASRIPSPAKPVAAPPAAATSATGKAAAASAAAVEKPMSIGDQVRLAVEQANAMPPPPVNRSPWQSPRRRASALSQKQDTTPKLTVTSDEGSAPAAIEPPPRTNHASSERKNAVRPTPVKTKADDMGDSAHQQYLRARAAALGSFANTPGAAAAVGHLSGTPAMRGDKQEQAPELPWAYAGETGPQFWSKLKPEFATCAAGQRQAPIAIDDNTALTGPAEPLMLDYKASNGSVEHTGRTLQVDVQGDNFLTVRGTRYRLVRMDFHQPAEEIINGKTFAMGAHLLHRSEDGQQAMLAVLLDPGETSPLIDQVWTYLPLDVADRVAFPPGGLNVASLVPQDQRYYQFFGSLTTPPCTEGVLWMVMRQPMTLDASQLRLFTQLFPNNARPVQPVNERVVRAAQ